MADQQRIVIYSASFFKIDGVTLTLRGLISHITNERGHQVIVLTADSPSTSSICDFECASGGLARVLQVYGGPVPAPGADYELGLRIPDAVKKTLDEYRPTAVHISNPDLVALWLINWVLREREDCSIMATLHTDFMEIVKSYCTVGRTQALRATSSFLRHVYGRCPAVYTPTEFMKRKVEREGWDTSLGVWGRGVDPDLFSPARRCQDLRRQLGLGAHDVAALWLGRVVHEKQPGVWLRAVQRVQREAQERYDLTAAAAAAAGNREGEGDSSPRLPPRVVGICVGEGEAMSVLSGVEGVVCVGWKTGEELAKVVASCDIMVAPSEIETFGRVTLEAMCCGLPCVVNKECGDHLVQDGTNGFCVPSGDEAGYTEGLSTLVRDEDLRSKMGAAGRKMALGYGTTALYDDMLEIYRSCRETQDKAFRASMAKKKGWPCWEIFGQLVYYIFEAAKMMSAVVDFFAHGRESEVVRLSAKALQSHLNLLGALLGLNFLALPPDSSSYWFPLKPPPTSRPSSSSSFGAPSDSPALSRSPSCPLCVTSARPCVPRSASLACVRRAVGEGFTVEGSDDGGGGGGVDGVIGAVSRTWSSLILQQLARVIAVLLPLVVVAAAVVFAVGAVPIKLP